MSRTDPEWHLGRAAGLREAMELMQALEADMAGRLESPSPSATTRARKVRVQAYRNAASRIATRLRRAEANNHFEATIARLGL